MIKYIQKIALNLPLITNTIAEEKKILKLFETLNLSKAENFFVFDSFVKKINSQNLINEKCLEDNDSTLALEIIFLLNNFNNKKKYSEKSIKCDSPLLNMKKDNYANHYTDNIFKEFIMQEDEALSESKNKSDINSVIRIKNNLTCISQLSPRNKNEISSDSCKFDSNNLNKHSFLKMKKLFQRHIIHDFFLNELKNEENALFWIRKRFFKFYLKDYHNHRKILSRLKELNNQILTKEFSRVINDLNVFFQVYSETILFFYDLGEINIFSFVSKEELLELVILLSFEENSGLYKFLFLYQQKIEKVTETQIEFNIKKLIEWSPEDFGLSKKLTLNQQTVDYFNKRTPKKQSLDMYKNKESAVFDQEIVYLSLLEEDYAEKNEETKENNKKNSEYIEEDNELEIMRVFKSNSIEIIRKTISLTKTLQPQKFQNSNQSIILSPPYEKAIKKLQEINFLKNPIQILTKIIETSFEIIICIRKFYEDHNQAFSGYIECDSLMNIFIYLCVKCQSPLLYSKCCLIQNFIPPSKASSIYGYYLTTLIASLSCLSDANFYSRLQKKHNKTHFISSLKKISSNINK